MDKLKTELAAISTISHLLFTDIKQQLIFFDYIVVIDDPLLEILSIKKFAKVPIISDMSFALEKNLLRILPELDKERLNQIESTFSWNPPNESRIFDNWESLDEMKQMFLIFRIRDVFRIRSTYIKYLQDGYNSFYTMLQPEHFHSVKDPQYNNITIAKNYPIYKDFLDLNDQKQKVFSIVLNNFPVPHKNIDIEEILDWKKNEEIIKRKLALKDWINEVSRLNLPPIEIQEKIEYLISEYKNFLNINKIKYEIAQLKALIKSPLEIIEDLVHIKWSRLPNLFFDLKELEINLVEAEFNFPGRALSYIVKVNEKFSTK